MYLPLGRDVSHIFDLAAAFAVSGCKKRKNVDLAIGGSGSRWRSGWEVFSRRFAQNREAAVNDCTLVEHRHILWLEIFAKSLKSRYCVLRGTFDAFISASQSPSTGFKTFIVLLRLHLVISLFMFSLQRLRHSAIVLSDEHCSRCLDGDSSLHFQVKPGVAGPDSALLSRPGAPKCPRVSSSC